MVSSICSSLFKLQGLRRLNDGAILNLYDAAFAARQMPLFEADLMRARHITLNEWQDRPLGQKALERLTSLPGSQL